MTISGKQLRDQLREIVVPLAMSAEDQSRWLTRTGNSVDEMALSLDDAVPGWFTRLESLGLLSEDARRSLRTLRDRLGEIPATSDAWNPEHLATSSEWVEIRVLASEALRLL